MIWQSDSMLSDILSTSYSSDLHRYLKLRVAPPPVEQSQDADAENGATDDKDVRNEMLIVLCLRKEGGSWS